MSSSPGRIFPGIIVLPIVLGGGTAVVLSLVNVTGHRLFSVAVSYLGCYCAALVPVIAAWSFIVVKNGWDKRPPPRLIDAVPFVIPVALGACLYYLIHYALAVPFLISVSKILGSLLIFVMVWAFLADLRERPERYSWAAPNKALLPTRTDKESK